MIAERLVKLLFPPKCILCQNVLETQETDLCHACRADSPECAGKYKSISFLDSWTAVWYYKENIRKSILRYKFYGARYYASAYGRLLAMRIRQEYPDGFDILTWVPVSRFRRLTRGYDQVQLLAEAVGGELDMAPLATLKKIRHNRPQSGIRGQAKRRANVMGAYETVCPLQIQGKRILLLDDVITTGETVRECARMLRTSGAKEVYCGCIATAHKHE